MDDPAVASTSALLSALEGPFEPTARTTLRRWQREATELLGEILADQPRANNLVSLVLSGQQVMVESEVLMELHSILDANIALARAEY